MITIFDSRVLRFGLMLLLAITFFTSESMGATRPKIGLALSGGGAKGFVHIGVLKVIEEAGIPIDYISGTSMGAFIGALYAMGYPPELIESLFLEQNWNQVQEDKISRRNISILNKDENEIFLRTFPMKGRKVELPPGLIAGQQLSAFINRLIWPARGIHDFSQFPIPFRCVTTDLVTGKAVVFEAGDLAEDLRASMSLLTIFTPVEVQGQLLVDGGLVRNFPVSDARAMGADVVIGVDVTAPLYTKRQLDSLPRIIDQSLSFEAVTSTQTQRENCDILIAPDIRNYNMGSFSEAVELIELGENEARKALPKLLALTDSLGAIVGARPVITADSLALPLTIVALKYQGLDNISGDFCDHKLDLALPEALTANDLASSIANLYGSGYFKRVTYQLEKAASGYQLIVKVEEQSNNQFKFSVHYDSDLKSAVLLNNTFQNVFRQGSILAFNFRLSEVPLLEASYFIYAGWKLGLGFEISAKLLDFNPYVWNYAREYDNISFEHRSHSLNFRLLTLLSNSFTAGAGLEFEQTHKNKKYLPLNPEGNSNYDQFIFSGFLRLDTVDKLTYPHEGVKVNAIVHSVHQNRIWNPSNLIDPYTLFSASYMSATPFGNKITLIERVGIGATSGTAKWKHYFKLGGVNSSDETIFPFAGLDFLEKAGQNLLLAGVTLQIEAWKNNYLVFEANWAKVNDGSPGNEFPDLIKSKSALSGYGVKFGYDSVIGPMEFSLVSSNQNPDLFVNINIGYPF